jgi:glycosyltransferase involved in cell wall biosynthesis
MRILVSVDPVLPVPPNLYGGIERIVDGLITELRRQGHEIGLVAHPESTCPVERLYPWPEISPSGAFRNLKNLFTLSGAVRDFRPEILHSFSRLGYLLPFLPTSLPKVMSYQRATGGPRNRIAARLGGRSFVSTGCSEFIAAQGRAWGGRWLGIPNFVDTDYYQYRAEVHVDAPLVFLSRLERIKGVHTAIEIAKRSGRRMVIAGNRVQEGDGAAYWEQEIKPHLDRDGISYVGPVNDAQKNELLGSAAAMVVPIAWDEPFGIVFAEALACGTPVISCPRGALPEIVRDGIEGFLVQDASEGARAVSRLGEISRTKCRQRAETCFSSKVVVSQYLALYRELIEHR